MRRRTWTGALILLFLSVLACGMPFRISEDTATRDVESAVEQTIAAQQMAATATALIYEAQSTVSAGAAHPSEAVLASQAAFASQAAKATQTALSLQATGLGASSNATAQSIASTSTAQSLAATVAAFDAQATARSFAQTATAQAYSPPPPPAPLPPPPSGMIRLSFARGATSTTIDGQIDRNQMIDYAVRALVGQTMMVNIYSPNDNVYLGIAGLSDGVPLMRTAVSGTSFSGVLPGTQDYRITVFSPDQKTHYTLQVIIPARIQFAAGAISAVVSGFVRGGEVNYYLLRARAGQTMTATIYSPGDDIFLTIYGVDDGSPLVRSVMAQTSWTGNLPGTQDYMIQAVSTGGNAEYTLEVIVQ